MIEAKILFWLLASVFGVAGANSPVLISLPLYGASGWFLYLMTAWEPV